jgi:hypothetical protein
MQVTQFNRMRVLCMACGAGCRLKLYLHAQASGPAQHEYYARISAQTAAVRFALGYAEAAIAAIPRL